MKSTLKEKESKNSISFAAMPVTLFEFNPTAKIERKNVPMKRPFSANSTSKIQISNSTSKIPIYQHEKENKDINKLIKIDCDSVQNNNKFQTYSKNNFESVGKLIPTLRKFKKDKKLILRKKEFQNLQDKNIKKEKIPKLTIKNEEKIIKTEKDALLNFSNFDDDSIIKDNQKLQNELDFNAVFNKFMEFDDENRIDSKQKKQDEGIKKQAKNPKLEKLSESVEIFINNFEKAGLERHPSKPIPKKPIEPAPQIKNHDYEAKNLEGKTAGEVFHHFKAKFNISEMLFKNLQQIKELKKNFKAIKDQPNEQLNKYQVDELNQNPPITKEITTQDSFEEVKEVNIENKINSQQKQYQSSTARVSILL